jgi:hypothetical protein
MGGVSHYLVMRLQLRTRSSVLDSLGNLGDFLGGLGVVVTLVYLATQIRQNTDALRRESYQNLLNHYSDLNTRLADRGFAELLTSTREGITHLDRPDYLRVVNYWLSLLRHYQNGYEQYRAGVLTDTQWEQLSWPIIVVLSSKGFCEFWDARQHHFSAEFAGWVQRKRDEMAGGDAA